MPLSSNDIKLFGELSYTEGSIGLRAFCSISRNTADGMCSVVLWMRLFFLCSQPGRERHTSSIHVIFLALKKFFLTNPTEFSTAYPNVRISCIIRILFLSAHLAAMPIGWNSFVSNVRINNQSKPNFRFRSSIWPSHSGCWAGSLQLPFSTTAFICSGDGVA